MAVTPASQAAGASRAVRIRAPGRGARRFLIGFLAGVAVVLGATAWYGSTLAGRILPGVVAGGIDLGGLTPADARVALVAALGHLEAGRVRVESDRGAVTLDVADVGRHVDVDGMLAEAAAIGHGGTLLDAVLAAARQSAEPAQVALRLGFDDVQLGDALAAFEERTQLRPLDARAISTPGGFEVVPAVPGVIVETDDVAGEIAAALADPSTVDGATFRAASIAIPPRTNDLDATRAAAAATRMARALTLVRGTSDWTIKGSRVAGWITFGGVGTTYAPSIDRSEIPAALKKVRKDVAKKPRAAEFLKTRSGAVFGVRASSMGRSLDTEATVTSIVTALTARAAMAGGDEPVKVTTAKVAPELTTEEATEKAPLVVRIGTWTTHYVSSARNGFSVNITIPARKLDGMVIKPGQVVEFWDAIGEVSFRAGYRLGAAIIGGKTVQGRALAGGICSTSTTLFNAAARAGLEIITRRAHWYYIDRYPLGLDATVSDSQTMRFRNDTKHPILITSVARPGIVRFDLWSVPNGRTVTWSKPRVTNVVKGYDTVQATSSLPKGERERIEYPVDGMNVSVTRTVRDASGRLIHRDTFVSNYHRMVGITLVGR